MERDRLEWTDLAPYPLITLQGEFTKRLSLDMGGAREEVTLTPANEVAFMSTALAMVQAGMGLTVCIPYASDLVHRFGLTLKPIGHPVVPRRFFVFTRRGRTLTPAAQGFLDFLMREMDQGRPFAPHLQTGKS